MSDEPEIPHCVPDTRAPVGGWTVGTAVAMVQEANAGHRRELSWAFRNLGEKLAKSEQVRVEDKVEFLRRLTDLNHENARLLTAQSSSVSREIWDASQAEYRNFKSLTEVTMKGLLTQSEFWQYKQTTDKALQLREGQSSGIGQFSGAVLQVASLLCSLAAVVTVIYLLDHGH